MLRLGSRRRLPAGGDGEHPLPLAQAGDRAPSERSLGIGVAVAAGVTVLILFVFLIASVWTGSRLSAIANPNALTIEVISHQWWWEVQYENAVPSQIVVTANEIHLPVGRPVLIKTTSADVIHSFWAPNIHGKKDLIPGRMNTTWIQVDRPGSFRGQCAEFCGFQHAHMAFLVIAEPPDRFSAWMEHQLQAAAEPSDPQAIRGRQVFLSSACVVCHTIRGTGAFGSEAPDLTHLASRRTIVAGMLPNTIGNLGGWILDPQTVKPGTRMPAVNISSEDLQPLLTYLHELN